MNCTSKIMKAVHDLALFCDRIKEAIAENVFDKIAMKILKNDLNKALFIPYSVGFK